MPIQWSQITNSPDYMSHDGHYIAVYGHSYNGYAKYYTFLTSLPKSKRKLATALAVGGLPTMLPV